jgi:MFS transporter, DHA1 family, tetracycline resistance protein
VPAKTSKVLLVLFITIFIDLLGFGIIIPILPTYAKDLHATDFEIGVMVACYALMNFVFAPFWGSLSDRIGRKPVILISVAITGLAYVVFAYADILFLLFASRTLAGIGSANISAAQAYIADVSLPQNRAKNFGIIGAAFGLGLILGPPIGGYVKENYGVSYIGWTIALLCLFNFILAFFLLSESLKEKNKQSKIQLNPIKDLQTALRRDVIKEILWLSFGFVVAFMMMQIPLALLWKEQAGFSDEQNGYAFSFMGVVTALSQGLFLGKLNKKFGEHKLILYGCIMLAIAGIILPLFASKSLFIPFELLGIVLLGLSSAFFNPALSAMISKSVSMQEQGKILGINQSFGSLARAAGPALGGFFYGIDYHMPYWVAALLMVGVIYWATQIPKILHAYKSVINKD